MMIQARCTKRRRGASLLEGALSMTVFLTILFGIMEFGRMVWIYNLVSHGAREATRYAIVRGSSSGRQASVSDIQAIVTARSPGLETSRITTTVTFSPDQAAGSSAKVAVTYQFNPVVPFFPGTPLQLSSTSQMVIQR